MLLAAVTTAAAVAACWSYSLLLGPVVTWIALLAWSIYLRSTELVILLGLFGLAALAFVAFVCYCLSPLLLLG
jgi:hypothetical protein